jgi:23S rRNA (guanine745-N1)-methyltransferase
MPTRTFHQLACPLDGLPLSRLDRQLLCPEGHSFDIARQGYANLLPVQHKKSRHPGDSAAMVAARTDFLDSGAYAPIAEQLAQSAAALLPARGEVAVLDAGCGDGYYLDRVFQQLSAADQGLTLSLVGLDIAKPAIIAACRRNKAITWLVGSNVRPPLLPGTVDLVLCLFGFPGWEAFAGVLRPGGHVLLVDPGPEHLIELREVIYPEVRRSPPPALDKAEAAGFRLTHSQTLTFNTGALSRAQLDHLLVMTPHLYRASSEGKAAVAALDTLALTVDVVFRTLVLADG